MGVQRFIDDDDGYVHWLAAPPDGFVLNTQRTPRPVYLMLHRATCPKISHLQHGASRWTHDYIKFSGNRAEIEALARHQLGGDPGSYRIRSRSHRSAAAARVVVDLKAHRPNSPLSAA